MTNLFAFTDPCEPMCDMCTPLEMTPIYVALKAERQMDALKPAIQAAGEAFQSIIDAFRPFIEAVTAIAKAMQRYDMSSGQPVRNPGMKPLLKNGSKHR